MSEEKQDVTERNLEQEAFVTHKSSAEAVVDAYGYEQMPVERLVEEFRFLSKELMTTDNYPLSTNSEAEQFDQVVVILRLDEVTDLLARKNVSIGMNLLEAKRWARYDNLPF